METNRPRGRVKNVTGNSAGVQKRGEGLGIGPVGRTGGSVGGKTNMDMNRPRERAKHITGNSKGVKKRGEGLGSGPVR